MVRSPISFAGAALLDLLLIAVFAVHLWAVGLATAAPFLCIVLEWRETRHGDLAAGALGRRLAWHALAALSSGMVLGLVIVGFFWVLSVEAWFQGLRIVPPRRLWFGLGELGFYLLCMGFYLALWDHWRSRRWLHRGLALAAGTNLAYHFPLLFAAISVSSTRSELWGTTLSQAELMRLMFTPAVLAKALHFWLASLAVAGLWLSALAALRPSAVHAQRAAVLGGRTALAATLLQLPTGVFLLWSMPTLARDRLLGGELLLSGSFAAGLLASLCLMYQLLAVSLGDSSRATVLRSLGLLSVTILVMVGVQSEGQKAKWQRAARNSATHARPIFPSPSLNGRSNRSFQQVK